MNSAPHSAGLKVFGVGFCSQGRHPDPPLDKYPLLAWTERHAKFGTMVVHLEDQKASVHDVVLAFVETPSFDSVAAKFGTDVPHVEQAVAYAVEGGYLGK